MPNNAGTIEASVRLNLKQLRADVMELDTLVKMHSKEVQTETERISTYLESMSNKQGKTLTKHLAEIKQSKALFISVYNSISKKDTDTREKYADNIRMINDLILREERLAESRKTKAEKEKAQAALYKSIAQENIAIQKKKEEQEKLNAIAAKQRALQVIAEERQKQEAYKKSASGILSSQINNLAFVAAWRIRDAVVRAFARSMRELFQVSYEYEASLANTQAVAQATASGLTALDEAAQKAGMTTKFTASQAADALYELASAGFDAYESASALNGVLLMAAATNESVASTATLLAATIRQFRMDAEDSARVANVLTASISTSQATMTKLKVSLTQAGTVASGLNIPLEHMVGLLDIMYDSGMQASRAGRAMRNVLAELSNESSRTVKKLKTMGIAFEDIDLNSNSLIDVFGSLAESGLSTGQIMDAFGKVIGPQMMVLVRSSRSELEKYVDKVTDTNRASTAAATQLDNLKGSILLLKSAWQAFGITLSKFWIPIARVVVDTATKLARGLNKVTSDVLGLTTETEKYVRVADKMTTAVDNYKRYTDLLTKSTGELTKRQKENYELELMRSKLAIFESLEELNEGYEEQVKVINDLSRAETVSARQDERQELYTKLARTLKDYNDKVVVYAQREADAQKNGFKLTSMYSYAKKKDLEEFGSTAMRLYNRLIRADYDISNVVDDLYNSGSLSGISKKALLDIEEVNNVLYQVPSLVDGATVSYARTFDELLTTLERAPEFSDAFDSAIKQDNQYLNDMIMLSNAALTIATEREESERDMNSTLDQTARYLNAKIISEKDLVGFSSEMVKSIKERASAMLEEVDVEEKKVVITAAAYEEMLKQLELSNEVRKALDEDIKKSKESAQSDIEKTDSMALVNAAYALQLENARLEKVALDKEIAKRKEEAEANLASKRAADEVNESTEESIELTDDSTESINENEEAMLNAAIALNALNELKGAEETLTYRNNQAEKERLATLALLTIAQQEEALARTEAYAKSLDTSNKYADKLRDIEDDKLKDNKKLIEEQGIFALEELRSNNEKRVQIAKEAHDSDLELLRESFAKENAEADATYLKRTSDLSKALAEDLKKLNEYYELAEVERKNADAIAIEEENASYTMLLEQQKKYYEADIADANGNEEKLATYKQKYDDKLIELEKAHNDKLAEIAEESGAHLETVQTAVDKAKSDRTKEYNDANIAEGEAHDTVIIANANELSEEEIALAKYTKEQITGIVEEGAKDENDAWKETMKEFEGYIDGMTNLLSAFTSLSSALTDARIADIERELAADISAIEKRRDAQLEAAGFRLDTERETLEKAIQDARASADEEAIIEAERALQKYEITQKAEDDISALEDEAARKKADRQYKSAMVAYRLGLAEIGLNTAKAIMQIWSDVGAGGVWGKSAWTAAFTGGVAAVQLAAAVAARPVKADYYATGGIVKGTAEGTHAIVGEGNRTETIFNADQMANLLMAIAQGNSGVGGATSLTIVLKNTYDKEVARYVINDCVNQGVYTIDGAKGIRKVAR